MKIIGVLLMLCGVIPSYARSFSQQPADVYYDPYEALQRKWPIYDDVPTQNHIMKRRHYDQGFYVPLIDGKPIYIPNEIQPQPSYRQHKAQAKPSYLIQNQEKRYPGLINSNAYDTSRTYPIVSNTRKDTNANLKNRYINDLNRKQDKKYTRKSSNQKTKNEPNTEDYIGKVSKERNSADDTFYPDTYSGMYPQCNNNEDVSDREGACRNDEITSFEESLKFADKKVSYDPVKLVDTDKSDKLIKSPSIKPEKKFGYKEDIDIYSPSMTDISQGTEEKVKNLKPYFIEENKIHNLKVDHKNNLEAPEHNKAETDKNYSKKQNEYSKVINSSTKTEHSSAFTEESTTPILQDIDVKSNEDDQQQIGSESTSESNTHISTQNVPAAIAVETVDDSDFNTLDIPQDANIPDLHANQNVHDSLKENIVNSFNSSSRSLVFNPVAQPLQKFQKCETPKNESGHCRYVHHCLLPSILSSLELFMDYVCIIQGRFVGVCCPELPVDNVNVKWKDSNNTQTDGPVKIPEECGISSNTRVVGGMKAEPKEYPWMAALLSEVTGTFFCGGAIINNRYILTAAHCTFGVSRNKIIARLGEYNFKDSSSSTHQDYKVAQIKRHGQYSRMTLKNDIALLKLSKPVVFNQFVSTICLPESGEDFVNRTAVLAGWGNLEGDGKTSDVLMEASLRVISNQECNAAHGLTITPELICTGSEKDNKGACNGDSGGPLMLLNKADERWKAIGLVSWGRRGCDPTFPTVYTRVARYLDWIKKHAK